MKEVVTHYTTSEGGKWLACSKPWDIPSDAALQSAIDNKVADGGDWKLYVIKDFNANITKLQLHSFKTSTGRTWDCLNGWRP